MARAKMRIVFESDSKETSVFEKDVEFTNLREPGGKEFIAQYMLSELAMESRWDSYYLALAAHSSGRRDSPSASVGT